MKINFLSLIFLCSIFFNVTTLFAKKDTSIVFCNSSLNKVKKKYASYYIKVFKQKDGKTGVIQYTRYDLLYMKGSFLDKELSIKEGEFEYYNSKGILKEKGQYKNNKKNDVWKKFTEKGVLTSKGQYINEKRTGLWVSYDNDGSMTRKSNYIDDKLTGEELKWYKDTLISVGQYELGEKVGDWQTWFKNRNVNSKGAYKVGDREGEWRFYFESGNLAALEVYEKGEVLDVRWFSETGESVNPIEPYEQSPQFPGGQQAMIQHLINTFEYPEMARELGAQGTVWVEFIVCSDGVLKDVKVVKGVSPSLDAEALRIIKLMPNWIPGLDHNRKTSLIYTIPIKCRLG